MTDREERLRTENARLRAEVERLRAALARATDPSVPGVEQELAFEREAEERARERAVGRR